ncbi:hypothetical protein D8I35_16375 [Corticibacter populi]|uniref:PKD/Chitinase domain-containing protein n=1 Tax=Corticibacter populi TaxID=1550736 RepID=A0A3M6QK51_9BURK|nr:PKD domain-containing protein [Corticibacter populi]RMX03458.1 hypothetical protein D8I35_16375 [Corticibacter populi]RZS29896.1 hypothetical protein EV687_3380 [Corticibacter populi]
MKLSLRNLMAGLGTALFLAACGGGGDDSPAPTVTPPTAAISASVQSVPIGTAVTLDGSGSSTPNTGSITYSWALSSKPDDSAVELSGTAATVSFTPDVEGDYVAELTVNDGTATNSTSQTISATNPSPVAVISPASAAVLLGKTVTLDGSGSRPPTGKDASALTYQWTLTEQPDGDTTTLGDATASSISFLPATVGIYRLRLVVSYGDLTSEAGAEVIVNVANSSPVAVAKINGEEVTALTVTRGSTVSLDGNASSDPDGDILHYRWSFPAILSSKRIPRASNAEISNHTSAQASFVADAVGTFYVDFTVYDQSVATTKQLTITVVKAEADTSNTAPVAVIGLWGEDIDSLECETGGMGTIWPYCTIYASHSYDVDGGTWTYAWKYWNKEDTAKVYEASGSTINVPAATAGTWRIELTLTDAQGATGTDSVDLIIKNGANVAPSVRAAVELAKVLVGDTIIFDGSGSKDDNDDELTYQWTLRDRPDGSNAVLNASGSTATVVADQPGIYSAELLVIDSKGVASRSTSTNYSVVNVFAKKTNNPPVVGSLGLSQYGKAEGQVRIIADGATTAGTNLYASIYDPDQDTPLYYAWTVASRPAGSAEIADYSSSVAVTGGSATVNRAFPSLIAGDYEVEFLLSDGVETSAESFTLSVVPRENYPTLLLEYAGVLGDVVNPPADTAEWLQAFLPIRKSGGVYAVDGSTSTTSIVAWYRLTAFDQDYTITVQDNSSGIVTLVRGVSDGQIIRKGESVIFSVAYETEPASAYELNVVVGVKERESHFVSWIQTGAGSE